MMNGGVVTDVRAALYAVAPLVSRPQTPTPATRAGIDVEARIERQRQIDAFLRNDRKAAELEWLAARAAQGDRKAHTRLAHHLGRDGAGMAIGQHRATARKMRSTRTGSSEFRRLARQQTDRFRRLASHRHAAIQPRQSGPLTITRKTIALRRSQARRGPPASNGDDDPHHVVQPLRLQAIRPRVEPHHIPHHRCLAIAGPNPLGEQRV